MSGGADWLSKNKEMIARHIEREKHDVERLLETFQLYWSEKQSYGTDDGELAEGILLDRKACELLVRWWGRVRKPVPQGRPRALPSLFGNPYLAEFEKEKEKIVAARKKDRGATKEAIAILAARHRVTFDAMRKRVRGK